MSNHTLGATTWDEFVGQDALSRRIQVEIDAVLRYTVDNETAYKPFPHTLFFAFPGAGKTTLARIIAQELGDRLDTFVMPVKQSVLDARIMEGEAGILFFDEIHRATPKQQEMLLTLMEENYYTSSTGQRIEAEGYCVLAATTREELLDGAFLDRFTLRPSFQTYSAESLAKIVATMAVKANVLLAPETLEAIGQASAGTPRNARRLILAAKALRDAYHSVEHPYTPTIEDILSHAEVEFDGLSAKQINYLRTLKRFNGQAGLAKIASAIRINSSSLPEVERYLFDSGLIDYSDRGRRLTDKGMRRIKDL